MTDKVIINASPLIFLSRSHHLALLKSFADEVWVPEPVPKKFYSEVSKTSLLRQSRKRLGSSHSLLRTHPCLFWNGGLVRENLPVLALSLAHTDTEVIIDDLAGRKYADSLDIPVRGTLGLVLVAKKRGVIPEARPVIIWKHHYKTSIKVTKFKNINHINSSESNKWTLPFIDAVPICKCYDTRTDPLYSLNKR